LTKEEFFENKEKQYAVVRALEIIGEATKNLSKELKAEHPEVQWSDITGMRDKLIHQLLWCKPNLLLRFLVCFHLSLFRFFCQYNKNTFLF